MSLSKLKISQKLPLLITGLAVLSALVTGFIAINKAEYDLFKAEENKLIALQASRVSALGNYLGSIEQDLSSLSHNEYVRQALFDYMNGWNALKIQGDPGKILQRLYITDNPNPTGSKEELDYAKDGSIYSQFHAKYHPWFRHFLRQRDYYDIFLFAPNGDLVYTVFKELDYATNVNYGEWKDTDLGEAFRAARDNPEAERQNFFDFKPYAPSHDAPASFISQPILNDDGSFAGVLVFQMPIARINNVMQVAAGLGESGETYIVGSDHLMRSDSRFSEESTILKTKVDGGTVDQAMNGNEGVETVLDYRGIPVVSAYGPIDFKGTRWAILAEIDKAEVMQPINQMKMFALFATLGVIVCIAFIAVFASRTISRPITRMSNAMNDLANDNFDVEIPGVERGDEIGQMAASVQVFKENGMEAKRLQKEQELAEIRAEEDKKRMMNEMANQFDAQVGGALKSLAVAAEKLQDASVNMEKTADETQQSSNSVAAAAEETSANVSSVASATEEMTASAQEISKQVADVAAKASMASSSANTTSQKVDELNSLVENIGEVVASIRDISEQTNLLALNATIEAARAIRSGAGERRRAKDGAVKLCTAFALPFWAHDHLCQPCGFGAFGYQSGLCVFRGKSLDRCAAFDAGGGYIFGERVSEFIGVIPLDRANRLGCALQVFCPFSGRAIRRYKCSETLRAWGFARLYALRSCGLSFARGGNGPECLAGGAGDECFYIRDDAGLVFGCIWRPGVEI